MFSRSLALSAALFLLAGCTEYHAPGGPADFRALGVTPEAQQAATPADINADFNKHPLAAFPANLAVVRIQAPGYVSDTAQGFGSGAYSVVLTRDVEPENAITRLSKLPQLRGVAPVGRLLLPTQLNSDRELREAAARLQCDMLLIYTLDTSFHDRDTFAPASIVTLGLSPTKATKVVTTASAVLLDTRSGFVYGVSEASSRKDGIASAWTTESAIDADRQRTETEAFQKLVGDVETMWKGVVQEFGPGSPRGGGTRYPTGG
ncbi:MAG TPA: hypothetical protein VH475_19010 [Tepidisphaeraceae bacterium]|jgi:hypothetical protein